MRRPSTSRPVSPIQSPDALSGATGLCGLDRNPPRAGPAAPSRELLWRERSQGVAQRPKRGAKGPGPVAEARPSRSDFSRTPPRSPRNSQPGAQCRVILSQTCGQSPVESRAAPHSGKLLTRRTVQCNIRQVRYGSRYGQAQILAIRRVDGGGRRGNLHSS